MADKGRRIAVISGKGGTGKTFVAVNLAAAAEKAIYIDCDVEEPNGHLFFRPEAIQETEVPVKIPYVNESQCNSCRACVNFCQYNALALIKGKPYVFDQVCHSCGGCALLCPQAAIREKNKTIGKIQQGKSGAVTVYTGILNIGEASGVPIIKALLQSGAVQTELPVLIDCPPGSGCGVNQSIRDADYCLLVTEPTRFGVHNLRLVRDLAQQLGKPYGLVLNKCLPGEDPAAEFAAENNIPVLGRIPFDNELSRLNAAAQIAVRESEHFRQYFSALLQAVIKEAQHEATADYKR